METVVWLLLTRASSHLSCSCDPSSLRGRGPDLQLWPEPSGCLQENTPIPRRRLETTNRGASAPVASPPLSSCSSRRTPADPEQLTSAISRRRRARGCLPESRIHGNRQAREDGGALMGGWGGCETSAKQHTSPLTLLTNAHTHKYTHTHTLWDLFCDPWPLKKKKKQWLSTNWRAEATANTHTHTHTHTWENTRKPPQRGLLFLRCFPGVVISESTGKQTPPQLPLPNSPCQVYQITAPRCAATPAPQPFDVLSSSNLICILLLLPVFCELSLIQPPPHTHTHIQPNMVSSVNIVSHVFHTAWCTSSFAAQYYCF